MQRVRQIHDAVWWVLEARSGAPSPFVSAQMRDAAKNGKVFLSENGPSDETRSVEYKCTTAHLSSSPVTVVLGCLCTPQIESHLKDHSL